MPNLPYHDELPFHATVAFPTEDVAEERELPCLVGDELHGHRLAWVQVLAHVEVRQGEAMLDIRAGAPEPHRVTLVHSYCGRVELPITGHHVELLQFSAG